MTKQLLLPCPFCHGKAGLNYDSHWEYYSIECGWCGAEGQQFYTRNNSNPKHLAGKAWNNRKELTLDENYKKGFLDCKQQFLKMFRGLTPELTEPK